MKQTLLFLAALTLGTTALGQEFKKKYQSETGLYWWRAGVVGDWEDRMDSDGDGTPELVLQEVDETGYLTRLLVIDLEKTCDDNACAVSETTPFDLERIHLERMSLEQTTHFVGFVDLLGTPTVRARPAAFATYYDESPVRLYVVDLATETLRFAFPDLGGETSRFVFSRATDKTIYSGELRFAFLDVDGDDIKDVIVGDPETRTVQVWGVESAATATEEQIEARLLQLAQSYPNPFRTSTKIPYTVEQPGHVSIDVFDVTGRRVRRLVGEDRTPGAYTATWDGTNERGTPVASGVYFYRLRVGDSVGSKQMIRIE